MGDVPASTASRVKVICGHCDKEYERRNLNDHNKIVHPGKNQFKKLAAKQSTIKFPSSNLKRDSVENNNEKQKNSITEGAPENIEVNDGEVSNADILNEVKLSNDMIMESLKVIQKSRVENETLNTDKDKDYENSDNLGYMLSKARSIVEIRYYFLIVKYIFVL